MCKSLLVLFFKKPPLPLPLAFRGGDLHRWAVTRKAAEDFHEFGRASPERPKPTLTKAFCCFVSKKQAFLSCGLLPRTWLAPCPLRTGKPELPRVSKQCCGAAGKIVHRMSAIVNCAHGALPACHLAGGA
jgi:hypothetical protein